MSVATKFVICPLGEWTRLCELRPTRRSLFVQLLGGAAILAVQTVAPLVLNQYGQMPAGVWHSLDTGNGPATFRLSESLDNDLVHQEWWAWIVSPLSPTIPVTQTVILSGSGGFTVPAGVTSVIAQVIGGGGGAEQHYNPGGFSESGGGGGAYASSTLAVTPGQTYQYQTGSGGTGGSGGVTATASWFSLTGTAPTNTAQGVLAAPGQDGETPPTLTGGAGGLASASIGIATHDGGDGGAGQIVSSGDTTHSVSFGAGATTWTVPAGVTHISDIVVWGPGGNGGPGDGLNGGGGGGGGGVGSQGGGVSTTPGTVLTIDIQPGGSVFSSTVTGPFGFPPTAGGPGTPGTTPNGGSGGGGSGGGTQVGGAGGAGFSGVGVGGGGGGGGSAGEVGGGGIGGVATISAGGVGGIAGTGLAGTSGAVGGVGGDPGFEGAFGSTPGAGGGGASAGVAAIINGADGQAIIFYIVPGTPGNAGGGGGGGGGNAGGNGTAGGTDAGGTGTGGAGGNFGGGQGGSFPSGPGSSGLAPGGGAGGGASVPTGGTVPFTVTGGAGLVSLTWTPATVPLGGFSASVPGGAGSGIGPPIITVIEAFDVVIPDPPEEFLTVKLPTVGPKAKEYLRELQAKILAAQTHAPTEGGSDAG